MSEITEGTEETHASAPAAVGERVLAIPELCLVVLIGATGSGKSTFAARHFRPTEVLSSDHYRAVVGDDPNEQGVTQPAFDALHYIAGLRLKLGKLTVIDATNVKPQDRAHLLKIAKEQDVLAAAIVLNVPERVCQERNAARPDRQFGPHVVRNHMKALHSGLRGLEHEGFRYVFVLSPAEIEAARIEREPLWSNRRAERGPFDLIGDVHGCLDELQELLQQLGYQPDNMAGWRHSQGRRVIFLGDLVDRGPKIAETVNLVRQMVETGQAFCVPGNHDMKLLRHLKGHKVQVKHGLEQSIAQIEALPAEERTVWVERYCTFADGLIAHLVLDNGQLVAAHAGMKAEYQGRASGRVRAFALFGETTGETDEFGLPVRYNWAADYRGRASVVYGHTPVPVPAWLNNTINIDTGCVFGGQLTALRWPERELVRVSAHQVYAEPVRPLVPASEASVSSEMAPDTLLRIEDVIGKQIISTRLAGNVIVEADRATAALEVISRFALDPRWLIYLPPTMSPNETSTQPDWLEHPAEAFAYFRHQFQYPQSGSSRNEAPTSTALRREYSTTGRYVICEEKHMGSRAVLVLCRDGKAANRRFGVPEDGPTGVCYTRTGRRFFDDEALNRTLIERLTEALGKAGFWERFETEWVCLDAELLPWNAKAQGLIREQYAPVAAAGEASLASALATVEAATARGIEVGPLLERLRGRKEALSRYATAYRAYCWDVDGLEGLRIAPFHLLATEGRTYLDRDHLWHMSELARLAEADPLFLATAHRVVDVLDTMACDEAIAWWLELTEHSGEGMVVKPLDFVVCGPRGLVQPAVKCRGREYLRIIYGPDYTEPENLERLRKRGLLAKRSLALREFALGVEALERFVQREPLWRVHQAVFGVLALESEPVDPRL